MRATRSIRSLAASDSPRRNSPRALNGGMRPEALKAKAPSSAYPAAEAETRGKPPRRRPLRRNRHPKPLSATPGQGSGNRRDFPHYEAPDTEGARIAFRKLSDGDTLRVAMLLPRSPRTARPMPTTPPEFYQGFLLGLDSVKRTGRARWRSTLYDTGRDTAKLRRIMEDESFLRAHLIVGPGARKPARPRRTLRRSTEPFRSSRRWRTSRTRTAARSSSWHPTRTQIRQGGRQHSSRAMPARSR